MEYHLMSRITQKRRTAGHGGQNATFAFDPQILLKATALCHPADQGFGLMNVEVVTDKMPPCGLGISGHHCLDMGQKICFGPRGGSRAGPRSFPSPHPDSR
jgi:hypothetical protein